VQNAHGHNAYTVSVYAYGKNGLAVSVSSSEGKMNLFTNVKKRDYAIFHLFQLWGLVAEDVFPRSSFHQC
jgi:hypothetical protein